MKTIPLKLAEKEEGMSRACELICVAAFASLVGNNAHTFEEVSVQQWEAVAKDAKARVLAISFEVNPLWTNADLGKAEKGAEDRESQPTFPNHLKRVRLGSFRRSGQRYCTEFQYGICQDECPSSALHRCAAVLKGGRSCHGTHPGSACWNTKRYISPQEVISGGRHTIGRELSLHDAIHEGRTAGAEAVPTQWNQTHAERTRTLLDEAMVTSSDAAGGYVLDDSIMKEMLPELRADRWPKSPTRANPEPPRLVAKVCAGTGKGELWLGPLPAAKTRDTITRTRHSIQICCDKNRPEELWATDNPADAGKRVPGAMLFRCDMSSFNIRASDLRSLMSCPLNSLRQGDNA